MFLTACWCFQSLVRARLDDGMLKRIGLTTLKVRKSVSNALQKMSEQADADAEAACKYSRILFCLWLWVYF